MFARPLLTLLLLFLAAAAQGMTPNRAGANGGGSCPEQAEAAAEAGTARDPVLTAGGDDVAPTAPSAVPAPAKATQGNRVKPGTRWHSFLPGMFK